MAKDPATLWYWNDWAGGTTTFSRHLKGCYMDLLHAQFNNGPLSIEEIKTVLGSDFGTSWPTLQKKFIRNEDGLFFNKRLHEEREKRMAYTQSRRQSATRKDEDKVKIYLIRDADTGLTKIGSSVNPQRRLLELMNQESPAILPKESKRNFSLIWHSESVERKIETSIHDFFEAERVIGEWFHLDEKDIRNLLHTFFHTSLRTDNEDENEIKDEFKGGVGEKLQQAFDEAYMEKMKLSKAYPGINLDAELATFKVKVISSVEDYQQHDVNGLRKAFNYQLRNAKPKENGITKALKQSAGLKELIRAKYGTEGAKPGTAVG